MRWHYTLLTLAIGGAIAGCVERGIPDTWQVYACNDPSHCDEVLLTTDGAGASFTLPGGAPYNLGRIEWPDGIPPGKLFLTLTDEDGSLWQVFASASQRTDRFDATCGRGHEGGTGVVRGATITVTGHDEGCRVIIDVVDPEASDFVIGWVHVTDGPAGRFEARWGS